MSSQRITLIDSRNPVPGSDGMLKNVNQAGSIALRRLRGGPSDRVEVIDLDNGHLSLAILATRGMGVWKGRCGDILLEWKSPVEQPVHPSLVDPLRRGGIGWLDGFNELICRCGLSWNGAPGTDTRRDANGNITSEQFLPLHGRIANLAAHEVFAETDPDGTLRVTGIVDEVSVFDQRLRLTSELSTKPESSAFAIRDTVFNLGGSSAEVEMLYHCNFGAPLLGGGSAFHTAALQVAPRNARAAEGAADWTTFLPPTQGYIEQVYFVAPLADSSGYALSVLTSPDRETAVAVRFGTATLPWFSLWKNTQAEADGYVCGLEPGSSLPNNRQFERQQGRVLSLDPGESVTFDLEIRIAETPEQTQDMIDEAKAMQLKAKMVCHSSPLPELSQP